jgi:hypothetical protein
MYILEFDSEGNIVGGEWLGKSRWDHPDYIWYPTDGRTANPYVSREDVLYLLSLSRE